MNALALSPKRRHGNDDAWLKHCCTRARAIDSVKTNAFLESVMESGLGQAQKRFGIDDDCCCGLLWLNMHPQDRKNKEVTK